MMSLKNNPGQNRSGSSAFPPAVAQATPKTPERRGLVLTPADELLQMSLELLRLTIELLEVLRMTLDEIRRDVGFDGRDSRATHLKTLPQKL
jgi:hypothetical protein